MNGPENPSTPSFSREQEEQASRWVARHERGLSEDEKRAFGQWLSESPANEACFFEHQVAWAGFDFMDEWKPAYSSPPNPDLFEAKSKRRMSGFIPFGGFAAAILLGLWLFQLSVLNNGDQQNLVGRTYQSRSYEKHFLEDGSSFYLFPGSEVRVAFSKSERTIEFVRGEAHFSVAHDPDRPFVVQSRIGRVTALGTVFSVRQDTASWEVYVTEGKVKVDESESDRPVSPNEAAFTAELVAGQKIVQKLSEDTFSPRIEAVTSNELKEKLAWKDQIIDMVSAPLEEILHEFRRFNSREVIIIDDDLKRLRMTVAIKPDNLQDFIDLLELSEGVNAIETLTGSILLSRSSN